MRFSFAFVAIAAGAALAGCHQDHEDLRKEVASLRQDVQGLRAQLGRAGGAPRPQQPPGPDPAKVYAVGVDGAPAVGPKAAPVTVVIAYEYACPWCNRERQAFAQLREAYGDDVRVVYRPFVVHPDAATDAALAACAADRQGHFAEVNEALWTHVFEKRAWDRASVEKAATSVPGIDAARLRADMDGECRGWIQAEQGALATLGVNATPQVWINGRPIPGGYKPLEGLKPVIDEELARAKQRIAAGTQAEAYYADWVMKRGLTRVASN
ncbi:MAG TPA: thioredoxin domain-containing protein [Kofleriaceae bacterium]|nr:thioredoxin domain-containing protein [Kofleriaceae bacterium]